MPKDIHEIKGFHRGTITTPSEVDIPDDAASSSLDIDNHSVGGILSGRYGDKTYHSDGFGTTTYQIETTTVLCVADVSDSLDGKYFVISSPVNNYLIWFSTGGGVPPGLSASTETYVFLKVTIAQDAASTVVASALETAIHNLGDFTAGTVSSTVTVTKYFGS